MRVAMMIAAAVAAAGVAVPAGAQSAQPGDIASYTVVFSNIIGTPSQPFDNSLGTLLRVHLDLAARTTTSYFFTPVTPGAVATISYTASSTILFAGFSYTASGAGLAGPYLSSYGITYSGSFSTDLDAAPFAAGARLGPYGSDSLLYSTGTASLQPGVPTSISSATFVSDTAGTLYKNGSDCYGSRGFDSCSNAYGILTFTYAVGGVPEPATWGMMILGFAAVGAGMRRQRRVAVA